MLLIFVGGVIACAPAPAETKNTIPLGIEDADGDGARADVDCDDDDPAIHPGADERCDGADEDCDGRVDDGLMVDWFRDGDGDGYGAEAMGEACERPPGAVDDGRDCDDADADVHPDAEEHCNEVDDDCNGLVDDGVTPSTWYVDADGDGRGVDGTEISACDPGSGWSLTGGDCDDADAGVSPSALEDCDARDQNCDGVIDEGVACPCPVEHRDGVPYMFCTTGSDWSTARDNCEVWSYALVTVSDAAEDAWLSATAVTYGDGYWWTGANDRSAEGGWGWVSGEPWTYSNFCSGEPNNSHGGECVPDSEEDCGVLSWGSGGCWNDYPCGCSSSQGEPYRFICEG